MSESDSDEEFLLLLPILTLEECKIHTNSKNKPKRHWFCKPRTSHWRIVVLESFILHHDFEFKTLFRVSAKTADMILNLIGRDIQGQDTKLRKTIPAKHRLLMYLQFVATGSLLHLIGNQWGYGKSSLSRIFELVSRKIVENLGRQFIFWPGIVGSRQNMRIFEQKTRIPGIVGLLDATHLPIIRPTSDLSSNDYYDRRGNYSITAQAVVSSDLQFMDVVIGWPGCVHDARIWQNSCLRRDLDELMLPLGTKQYLVNNQEVILYPFILADSAYPNSRHLVTTYESHRTRENPEIHRLNERLSAVRQGVERAFGILKGRFRILTSATILSRGSIEKLNRIFYSCFILHNICISEADDYFEEVQFENQENSTENEIQHEFCSLDNERTRDTLFLLQNENFL